MRQFIVILGIFLVISFAVFSQDRGGTEIRRGGSSGSGLPTTYTDTTSLGFSLSYDGTNAIWISKSEGWIIQDEFIARGGVLSSSANGLHPWRGNTTGNGANSVNTVDILEFVPGMLRMTVTNAYSHYLYYIEGAGGNVGSSINFTNATWLTLIRFKFTTNMISADDIFTFRLGYQDSTSFATPSDSVFLYATNGNLYAYSSNAGTVDQSTTSVIVYTNTYRVVAILYEPSHRFLFFEGASATNLIVFATNTIVPRNTSGDSVSAFFGLSKTNSVNGVVGNLDIDYYNVYYKPNFAR